NGDLPGLVQDLDDDVLPEVPQRGFTAAPGADRPDLVGPAVELGVVRDAAFERDRLELGAPGRLAWRAGIPAAAVLDHLGGALERADLADSRDDPPVPQDEELEVLVRVEPLGVDDELGHPALHLHLASELFDLDNHELG